HIYARAGRFDDAIRRYEGAIAFGPPRHLTAADWRRQVEFRLLAIHVVRRDWSAAHRSALAILEAGGIADEVRERFADRNPREAVTSFLRRSAADMASRPPRDRVSPTDVATLHALAGESDAALGWLERAADERDPELVFSLRNPELDALRDQPRYRALRQRFL